MTNYDVKMEANNNRLNLGFVICNEGFNLFLILYLEFASTLLLETCEWINKEKLRHAEKFQY